MKQEVPIMERKHPDLFTPEEAAAYLHLDSENGERTLKTLREQYNLIGQKVGKGYMYHRKQLDACVREIFEGVGNGRGVK